MDYFYYGSLHIAFPISPADLGGVTVYMGWEYDIQKMFTELEKRFEKKRSNSITDRFRKTGGTNRYTNEY